MTREEAYNELSRKGNNNGSVGVFSVMEVIDRIYYDFEEEKKKLNSSSGDPSMATKTENFWSSIYFKYEAVFDALDVYVPLGRHDLESSKLHSILMDIITEVRSEVEKVSVVKTTEVTVEDCYKEIYNIMFAQCVEKGYDRVKASHTATLRAVKFAWAAFVNRTTMASSFKGVFDGRL